MVLIAVRVHPFPSRTRKLSSPAPKILVWRRTGKIGNADTENGLRRKSVFLYLENHWLGQRFKRSLMAMIKEKTPFAIIKVRSGNCTEIAKGGHSDGLE